MIDIIQYRSQIGLFRQKVFSKKFLFKQNYESIASWNRDFSGKNLFLFSNFIVKLGLLIVFLSPVTWDCITNWTTSFTEPELEFSSGNQWT